MIQMSHNFTPHWCPIKKKKNRKCFFFFLSSGPKPCEACRQEEIYEEPISILNSNEVIMCCSYCIATQWDVFLPRLWLIQASPPPPLISDSHSHACYVYRLGCITVSSGFRFHLQVFPDNAAGREIASLPARCLNQDCSWTGSIKQYEVRGRTAGWGWWWWGAFNLNGFRCLW